MRRTGPARLLICALLAVSLCGCVTDQAQGPNPILSGAAANQAHTNKEILLQALQADAGGSGDWYEVAEAGFNFVDDQCRAYFDELFFLDRGKDQLKSGLAAAGQTTSAILAVTGAAKPSLAIAAQAFGFAISGADIASGTYLYRLPPATTLGFVEKLQLAYRDAALRNRRVINSPTSAYYAVQRYLNLCLPPTIEAEITKQIASTRAFSVPTAGGEMFAVETFSVPPAAEAAILGPTPIVRVNQPLKPLAPKTHPSVPSSDGLVPPRTINKFDVASFRRLVGLDETGPFDRELLARLKACLRQLGREPSPVESLTRNEVIALRDAADAKSCKP